LKEIKLKLNGTSCNSCEKIITKVVEENQGKLNSINIQTGETFVLINEDKIDQLKKQLFEKGFGQKTESRGDFQGPVQYIKQIISGSKEAEMTILKYTLGSAVLMFLFIATINLAIPSETVLFQRYNQMIAIATISSLISVFAYTHMKCYKKDLSCTNGMMIGMTIGMVAGFLCGAIIGATNGMFIGSIFGVLIGASFGFETGRHCGIMGAMEGIMAGLMSGTMGAMLSVMMINDNLIPFLYFLIAACTIIVAGLSYMMNKEAGSRSKNEVELKFTTFLILNALLVFSMTAIMILGPKGGIVYQG
jgi:copper chaperone CopZ